MCPRLCVANFANVANLDETYLFFMYLAEFDLGQRYFANVTLATLLGNVLLL